ncbi:TIGR00366 family protein [Caulobacter sp. SLTY]|uniref:AbgT family transporter n=1 Tax=Caulobacter sp. SLTY TaxID=2683262 RepID=UPI00141284B4|nr:AbgT family transporter [Caulobacter sp. SLTY]NBB17110.1 TIGR00366 family protein [Caulobacter sp. SLTY]
MTTKRPLAMRFLDGVERLGDKLPDPVFIFVWLVLALVAASAVCAALGVQVVNPGTGETLVAESLLDPANVQKLLVEMPKTLTGFAPLGYVLLVMLGAGVAERVGLLSAAVRGLVRRTPKRLLAPVIIILGLFANHAADSGFIVLIPLAGAAFAAAGRHPVAGIACAFASCVGAFAGNPTPSQFDALILGFTEPAVHILNPDWKVNLVGNWWFTAFAALIFVPVGWWVTEAIVEPRLGPWTPPEDHRPSDLPLSDDERRGLWRAGLSVLAVFALWAWMALSPGAPLRDTAAADLTQWTPFFRSLIAGFFVLFLVAGVAFGISNGVIKSHRDVVRLAGESMQAMAPYIVLAFAAAHFIAMFNWSNLGAILAINGAEFLHSTGVPMVVLLLGVVVLTAVLDLFIGSASAKWAALAPVLVPMFMQLGVSPEMTTAAYRMGDSTVNMSSPLMPYFPLVLAFCQRWKPGLGVGGLMSSVLPYSFAFMGLALGVTGFWALMEWPTGPGAPFHYSAPAPVAP